MKFSVLRKGQLETTADASDLATAISLANSLKSKYNDLVLSYDQLILNLNSIQEVE